MVDSRLEVDRWRDLIIAREDARTFLADLEKRVDGDDRVPFGATRVRFRNARFLGVSAYLTTTWAISDSVTGLVGRVLCTPEAGRNSKSPARLISQFIVRKTSKRDTASALFDSIRQSFGWPAAISYSVRNHFVHDGAQDSGLDFFEGPSAGAAFRVTPSCWANIEQATQDTYEVSTANRRPNVAWPADPPADLRGVLGDPAGIALAGRECGDDLDANRGLKPEHEVAADQVEGEGGERRSGGRGRPIQSGHGGSSRSPDGCRAAWTRTHREPARDRDSRTSLGSRES